MGSLGVPPDATGVRLFGHVGLVLEQVATYVVFAGMGLVYSRATWARERGKLERAQIVTPEQKAAAARGRWNWRGSMALIGAALLLASVAWSAYFQVLPANSAGWLLAAFGTFWLALSRRIGRFQRAHNTLYFWMPDPHWSWHGREVVRVMPVPEE